MCVTGKQRRRVLEGQRGQVRGIGGMERTVREGRRWNKLK